MVPVQTPALKIPLIASHPISKNVPINKTVTSYINLLFIMLLFLFVKLVLKHYTASSIPTFSNGISRTLFPFLNLLGLSPVTFVNWLLK